MTMSFASSLPPAIRSLPLEGRVALTLRLACGLTTAEIARSFLVPEKTLGQRIFRAKKTLSEARVPFETPRGEELRTRVQVGARPWST